MHLHKKNTETQRETRFHQISVFVMQLFTVFQKFKFEYVSETLFKYDIRTFHALC